MHSLFGRRAVVHFYRIDRFERLWNASRGVQFSVTSLPWNGWPASAGLQGKLLWAPVMIGQKTLTPC